MEKLLLQDAQLILPDRIVTGSLLIIDGLINQIIPERAPLPASDRSISLNGNFLAPGFIDIHFHGAVGVDLMEADAQDFERLGRFLLSEGVTGYLATLVPASDAEYRRALGRIDNYVRHAELTNQAAARIVGVHFEGPFVNKARCGALQPDRFRQFSSQDAISVFTELESNPALRARLMTLAPELPGGLDLVKQLRERGFVISVGHSRAPFEVLEQAAAIGARHITHFFNALDQLHHRDPGVVGWGLLRDDVTVDLIADYIHVNPQVIRLAYKCKGSERMALISDAIPLMGLGDGEFIIWGEKITIKDGRTSNQSGAIAGSVITMRNAVQNIVKLGIPLVDAVKMASLAPARVIGLDKDLGSIEVGKRADLIAFDDNLNITFATVGGSAHIQSGERF